MNSILKKIVFGGLLLFMALSISSCNAMFNAIVLPNQCKKCVVVNIYTEQILETFEGCGGSNTNLEGQAKEAAYNLSRSGTNLCDLEVRCETWKQENEE